MRKRSGLITAFVVLLAAIAGTLLYLLPPAGTGAQQANRASVRLAWVYDMAETGLFVAQDQGSFKKQGFDLKIEQGGLGLDPLKLVASGTNDFGVAGAGNLLLARAQGVPVVAIGAEFQHTPVGFIVRANSNIRDFRDFAGKRVGIQTGADTDVLYRALLARNDMTSRDVHEMPIQFDPTPFATGQIDVLPGYVTNQPVTLRSKGIDVKVISAASQGLNYYGNVYFTSERMLREHPERVRRFLLAVSEGWGVALQNRRVAIASVQSRSKDFLPADLERIYDAVVPFIRPEANAPVLSMTDERWQTTARVLQDAGLLKGPIDISRAYTNDFLK